MAEISGFPVHGNGDVQIMITPDRRIQLHSEILRASSDFFNSNLTDATAIVLPASVRKQGIATRWRFDLQYQSGKDDGCGKLEQVTLDARGRPISTNTARPFYPAGQLPVPVFNAWEKVLGAIYNRPLKLSNHIGLLVEEIIGIVNVSEELGCVQVISRTVDSLLNEHSQQLYQSITNNPIAWGQLGVRVQSYSIVREAIIHATGQWKMISKEAKKDLQLSDQVALYGIIEQKDKELTLVKAKIEQRLASVTLPGMEHLPTGSSRDVGRASYANDVIDWIAVSLFRQFLAGMAFRGMSHDNEADGGYTLYKLLFDGEEAYITRDDLIKFHQHFAMSPRGCRNLQVSLANLKAHVKEIVKPLFKNESNLKTVDFPVYYLTCADFHQDEVSKLWRGSIG